MKPTVEQMARHIEDLCRENGITIHWRQWYAGTAWRKKRAIAVPAIRTPVTYALALHEIGHILGANPRHRLEKEAAAWRWAKANALEWGRPMQRKMRVCLASYLRWAGRTRVRVHVPGKGSDLWKLAGVAPAGRG